MSEEIFQSAIQRTLPLSCPRNEYASPRRRIGNTRILNVMKFYKDRGGVGFKIDELDGAITHSRIDSIAS